MKTVEIGSNALLCNLKFPSQTTDINDSSARPHALTFDHM